MSVPQIQASFYRGMVLNYLINVCSDTVKALAIDKTTATLYLVFRFSIPQLLCRDYITQVPIFGLAPLKASEDLEN